MIKKMKKAFSLLEVIFVLVILGIVASISSQIIVQVYENYIIQKAVYNVSTKTEIAANQIVNRLTYRIPGTTISKDHNAFVAGIPLPTEALHWRKLQDVIAGGNTYTTIEWIGYDNDSFAAEQTPGWSGIADYSSGSTNIGQFLTPGSNLSTTATILTNISKNETGVTQVDLTSTKPAAVIFAQKDNFYNPADNKYNPICMGLIPNGQTADTPAIPSSTDCIFSVTRSGNNILQFTGTSALDPKRISERYKLAWSAYALAPIANSIGLHDLVLYSNYQPWNGDNYLNATQNTILKNISVFKFSENGGTIQFKLCAVEKISNDVNITTCKEKVVIR
jgi:prepilin-type N-terminal cleavage/methylation domain-containing protein